MEPPTFVSCVFIWCLGFSLILAWTGNYNNIMCKYKGKVTNFLLRNKYDVKNDRWLSFVLFSFFLCQTDKINEGLIKYIN